MPLELAKPSGCRALAELSSRRGVPTPLQATITTEAAWNCSTPSASKYSTPVAMPSSSVTMRCTRQPVRNSTRARMACGQ